MAIILPEMAGHRRLPTPRLGAGATFHLAPEWPQGLFERFEFFSSNWWAVLI